MSSVMMKKRLSMIYRMRHWRLRGENCVRGPRVPSLFHFAQDMTPARGKGDSDRPVSARGGVNHHTLPFHRWHPSRRAEPSIPPQVRELGTNVRFWHLADIELADIVEGCRDFHC